MQQLKTLCTNLYGIYNYVLTFVFCFSNGKDEENIKRVCKYMLKFFILSKNEMTILTPILNMRICVNLLKELTVANKHVPVRETTPTIDTVTVGMQ